ncbi:MAG: YggS family pyridoxal phosphate-dependent enzyme [Myxococcales bacterium]|nr:YggS family pyridoxal phosphate-dependent enzyme [Myxococcales bacterium]
MSEATLQGRLAALQGRLASACARAGRSPDAVTLVAVSKTFDAAAVAEAYALGLRDFGENYVQELSAKQAALAHLEGLRWHMIGHLQRNKARAVVPGVAMLQSLDSVALAVEVSKRAAEARRSLPVLVQVNVGGEAQKSGCAPGALGALLDAVEALPGVSLSGLMTVPPHTEDPAGARPFFDALLALREAHGGPSRLPVVSMGMTHDLEVAVAAGATMVRVGNALFGSRKTD